jgi:hypothetical protein
VIFCAAYSTLCCVQGSCHYSEFVRVVLYFLCKLVYLDVDLHCVSGSCKLVYLDVDLHCVGGSCKLVYLDVDLHCVGGSCKLVYLDVDLHCVGGLLVWPPCN